MKPGDRFMPSICFSRLSPLCVPAPFAADAAAGAGAGTSGRAEKSNWPQSGLAAALGAAGGRNGGGRTGWAGSVGSVDGAGVG